METKNKLNKTNFSKPTVRAVLVVDDESEWTEDVLVALAAQDYQNIKTLVIDKRKVDSTGELKAQLDSVLPGSTFIQMLASDNFATGANFLLKKECQHLQESFYLFMREEVLLGATCVRRMIEVAIENNAGIVGPKILSGDSPSSLEDMGSIFDHFCSPVKRVEKGETDQGQHDLPRQVSVVPDSLMLVRADLFNAIKGYDIEVPSFHSTAEICSRAQLVGSKILLASNAVATSFGGSKSKFKKSRKEILRPCIRLRIELARNHGVALFFNFLRSLGISVSGIIYGIVTGRFALAWGHFIAWPWNLKRIRSLKMLKLVLLGQSNLVKNSVKQTVQFPHHSFRRAVTGSAPSGVGPDSIVKTRFHQLWAALLGPGGIALIVAGSILSFGSRNLIKNGLPAIGRFQHLPTDPFDLVRSWWHGWRTTAMGIEFVGPDGLAFFGLVAAIFPGDDQLLWSWIIISAIPFGALGVWRLVCPIGGGRSRAVATLIYLSVPIPYDSLREGRLTPLMVYAFLPWLAKRLAISQGVAPYGSIGGEPGPGVKSRGVMADGFITGMVLALGISLNPVFVMPATIIFLALLLGTLLSGTAIGVKRLLNNAVISVGVVSLVHLHLLLDIISGRSIDSYLGFENLKLGELGFSGLFSLDSGNFRNNNFAWLVILIPALALFVGSGKHLFLGARTWLLILIGLGSVWVVDQGWWYGRSAEIETLFVPVALGMAWASAVAIAGIGSDLNSSLVKTLYLRRFLVGVTGLVLCAGIAPVIFASFNGSWNTPKEDLSSIFSFLTDSRTEEINESRGGDYRVIWIGEPSILPAASSMLTEDIGFAVTDLWPDLVDQWPYSLKDSSGLISTREGIAKAIKGDTNRLGEIVGVWGIKYLVLVEGNAPVPHASVESILPRFYEASLTRQLDLARVEGLNSSVTIFENTAYQAVNAVVRDRNRKVVPSNVTPAGWNKRIVVSQADGAFRWMMEPLKNWEVIIDGSNAPILKPGNPGGLFDRPSVRVAAGTTALLKHDSSESKVRHRLQVALLMLLLLASNWFRLNFEKENS